MSRFAIGAFTAVLGALLVFTGIQDAEAKRLGGGKSFGSRPAYSQPYQQRATTPPAAPSRGAESSPAAAQNMAQRQALANRGGLMGMLGGLALGGLLGALLFGGAFENINFLDIAVLLGVVALAYWFFASRRARAARAAPALAGYGGGGGLAPRPGLEPMLRREAALETGDRAHAGWGGAPPAEAPAELPPGFDEAAFLEGARRAYRMLQDAWDKGDLADLRALTTEDVFAELEGQLAARQGKSRTEVLHLDARLLEARDAGLEMEASVLFDAFLREEDAEQGADDRGHQVREVWHFVRPAGRRQPTWFLDGIQQLE